MANFELTPEELEMLQQKYFWTEPCSDPECPLQSPISVHCHVLTKTITEKCCNCHDSAHFTLSSYCKTIPNGPALKTRFVFLKNTFNCDHVCTQDTQRIFGLHTEPYP